MATFAAALAAGLWAGSPGARQDRRPPGAGWAPAWPWPWPAPSARCGRYLRLGALRRPGRALALLFLVGVPVYAVGFLLPALAAWGAGFHAARSRRGRARRGAAPRVRRGGAGRPGRRGRGRGAQRTGAAAGGQPRAAAARPGRAADLSRSSSRAKRRRRRRATSGCCTRRRRLRHAAGDRDLHPGGRRQPELRLYVDEEIESGELERSGAPTFAYVAAAERWLREMTPNGASYLFLGGGAYTLPRRMAEDDPGARITVVELDPAVTRAAYRWFGLRPEHGITSVHGDARAVAQTMRPGEWDRVVVDVYGGGEQRAAPPGDGRGAGGGPPAAAPRRRGAAERDRRGARRGRVPLLVGGADGGGGVPARAAVRARGARLSRAAELPDRRVAGPVVPASARRRGASSRGRRTSGRGCRARACCATGWTRAQTAAPPRRAGSAAAAAVRAAEGD